MAHAMRFFPETMSNASAANHPLICRPTFHCAPVVIIPRLCPSSPRRLQPFFLLVTNRTPLCSLWTKNWAPHTLGKLKRTATESPLTLPSEAVPISRDIAPKISRFLRRLTLLGDSAAESPRATVAVIHVQAGRYGAVLLAPRTARPGVFPCQPILALSAHTE